MIRKGAPFSGAMRHAFFRADTVLREMWSGRKVKMQPNILNDTMAKASLVGCTSAQRGRFGRGGPFAIGCRTNERRVRRNRPLHVSERCAVSAEQQRHDWH